MCSRYATHVDVHVYTLPYNMCASDIVTLRIIAATFFFFFARVYVVAAKVYCV